MKVFLGSKKHNLFRTVEKNSKNQTVLSQECSTFFKKGPHLGQNSRPGENDPYMCSLESVWPRKVKIPFEAFPWWSLLKIVTET